MENLQEKLLKKTFLNDNAPEYGEEDKIHIQKFL